MDIEKLKLQRQLNVQEQNALEKHRIFQEASYWRNNGIPTGLRSALAGKNFETESSIFLEYSQDFPGLSTDEGVALTRDGKFYEFQMDLNRERTELIEFHVWEDITLQIAIKERHPGTGSTWGFLALEVLSELNSAEQRNEKFSDVEFRHQT